jgi:hypothetical protein
VVLIVADSDSYLKWAGARYAEAVERGLNVQLVVVRSDVTPSASQIVSALDGRAATAAVISFAALVERLRTERPDVLLLACRGLLIYLLLQDELHGERPARVIATGLPGVWMPPTELGVRYRTGADVIVVHSAAERDAVRKLLPRGRLARVGLASLVTDEPVGHAERPRVVFAPQALVPRGAADRARVLDTLVDIAKRHPDLDVVVKLRGVRGEPQTHREAIPYEDLAHVDGRSLPANVVFETGPLRDYLGGCVGFVTVSSTATLEAVAAGVPSLCLTDFGVSDELYNSVFVGSGLFGDLDDLRALRFGIPDQSWRERNYFHDAAANDWLEQVEAALAEGEPVTRSIVDAGLDRPWVRARRRVSALGEADARVATRVLVAIRHARTSLPSVRRK